ncbi:hypothetical protein SADUNF_Sadunf19G0073300 [Salix dunnii]|uniref:Uncharacterized protein n=1 Tax=Salix dunnii TaxID=1413687 RepID=A0A835J284_9ROSI|nr:hypothetical protein SADUNF_Sadunf19G0073300 [Salix dunnii]
MADSEDLNTPNPSESILELTTRMTEETNEEVNLFQQEIESQSIELHQERVNENLSVVHGDTDIQTGMDSSMEHEMSNFAFPLSASPLSEAPAELSSKSIPEVSTPTTPLHSNDINVSTGYVLPHRNNRRKPPNRYSSEVEDRRSKYPIANYVSTKGLDPANLADEKYVGEGRSIIEQGTEDTDVDMEEAISLQVENYEILISSCAKPARNVSESCEEPAGEKRFLSYSASKLITEESSNEMMVFGSSCIISGSEKGNSGVSATSEPDGSQNEIVNCVSPSSLSIIPSEVSLALKSPTPSVSPRISSRKSLRASSMLTASQKDSKDERSNPILPVDMGEREVLLEEIKDLRSQLQYYTDSSSSSVLNRNSLMKLTYSCEPRLTWRRNRARCILLKSDFSSRVIICISTKTFNGDWIVKHRTFLGCETRILQVPWTVVSRFVENLATLFLPMRGPDLASQEL